jgi:hypothetical protein
MSPCKIYIYIYIYMKFISIMIDLNNILVISSTNFLFTFEEYLVMIM